ncbi:MAG: C1 family peptidase, partial [Thermoguttaceae bacterium]
MHGRIISLSQASLVSIALAASVFLSAQTLSADSFDWQSVNGQNWNSAIESQFGGTCWDFSSCGNLDAKYMLTRNDPNFAPQVSEEQIDWETNPDMGSTSGGSGQSVLNYFTTHGVVSGTECPYQSSSPDTGIAPYWPLAAGWQNRVWKSTSNWDGCAGGVSPATTAAMKAYIKLYGPLEVGCQGDVDSTGDLFDSVAAVEGYTGGTISAMDHEVSLVGYVDDPNMANHCGGYWIIKNSWGTGCGVNGTGYYYIPYNNIEVHGDISAITGAVYYTGPMYHTGAWDGTGTDYTGTAATNTWKGTTSGVWDTTSGTSGNWMNNSTGSTFTWVNQELQAIFDNTGNNRAITINGTIIAHGLTFNAGGTGYSFGGGSLTVTSGGIQANENVTFNSQVYIGGPQSWTVANGKTLTVNGALHTIISDLTFNGPGNTVIAGTIDGGGVMNTVGGAAPGGLIQAGAGNVTLSGACNFAGNITVNFGVGPLNLAPTGGSASYTGGLFGGGTINIGAGTVSLGGAASSFTGTFNVLQACMLQFAPAAGVTNVFSSPIGGGGAVAQNGPGVTILAAMNNYSGATIISSGALQASFGAGIPATSFLALDGGVLQSNGGGTTNFTRSLGTSGATFQWTANGGGFSA